MCQAIPNILKRYSLQSVSTFRPTGHLAARISIGTHQGMEKFYFLVLNWHFNISQNHDHRDGSYRLCHEHRPPAVQQGIVQKVLNRFAANEEEICVKSASQILFVNRLKIYRVRIRMLTQSTVYFTLSQPLDWMNHSINLLHPSFLRQVLFILSV